MRLVQRFGSVALAAVLAMVMAVGQSTAAEDAAAPPAKSVLKKRLRRLPNYYAKVLTEEQKEKVAKIQDEYQPKIDALKAQLNALQKEMNEKISGVLTEEQKKEIEDAKTKAKAGKGKKEPAKPAETAPAVKPAQ